LVLSAVGAAAGLACARIGMGLFQRAIADTNPPFWIVLRIDERVLLFVAALAAVATVVSTLAPALRATLQDTNSILKDEGRSASGLKAGAFSRVLVVVEMTLSFVLLVVSGLMIRSIVATATVKFPFAADVYTASIN